MTATRSPDRLYELLPAVYREQDADERLRRCARCCGSSPSQVDVVEQDVARLWNDLFIETCRRWVIPYIGDLVSNNLLYDPSRIADADTAAALFTDLRGPDLRPPRRDPHPRRRREDDLLPPPQGHAADARGARARRHRLGRARRRVLRAARLDAAPRAHPPAGVLVRRPLARARRARRRRRSTRRATPSTCAPISQYEGWHSITQHRLLPLAARQLPAARRARPPCRRGRGASTSARSATRRRCSPTCAARATRRASPPSCTCRARSAARSSSRTSPRTARRRRRTSPTSTGDRRARPPLAANPDAEPLRDRATARPSRPTQIVCARLDPWPATRPVGRGRSRSTSQPGGSRSATASPAPRRSTSTSTTASRPTSAAAPTSGATG